MVFTEMLGLISNDQITHIDGYRVEAEDIFWSMDLDGKSAKQAVGSVLTEAFMIELNVDELDQFSTRIHSVVKRYKK